MRSAITLADYQLNRLDARYRGLARDSFLRAWDPTEELTVARKYSKKDETKVVLPPKRYWHLYSLQALQSEKLIKIVNKVLHQEYVLIK